MKPFVFNKDSWHYWLAAEVGSFSKYRDETNICEYTRAVLKGGLIFAAIAAVAAAMIYWVVITAVWWVVVIQHGFFNADGPIILSGIIVIFGAAAAIASGVPRMYRKVINVMYDMRYGGGYKEPVKTDNFLTHAYRSWKEKTCVRVTLVGDTSED